MLMDKPCMVVGTCCCQGLAGLDGEPKRLSGRPGRLNLLFFIASIAVGPAGSVAAVVG